MSLKATFCNLEGARFSFHWVIQRRKRKENSAGRIWDKAVEVTPEAVNLGTANQKIKWGKCEPGMTQHTSAAIVVYL